MRRILLSLALLALPLGACGTAGGRGGFSSFFPGPTHLALPVFLDAAIKTLVLRNLVDVPATVNVTSIPGPTIPFNVPARGETRVPLNAFTEGWLVVDTTPTAATTGFVEPYLVTERSGPDAEATQGAVLQTTESVIPVHPNTDRVTLLNRGPAVMYRVRSFGATDSGTNPQLTNDLVPVPADSFLNLDIALAAIQNQLDVGHISVVPEPPAPVFPAGTGFTLAAHQDEDIVLEVDDRFTNGVSRLLSPNGTSQAELMVEFGRDPVTGGYEDFDVLVSNFTGIDRSFTIQSIYDEFGSPIKTLPQTFTMPARQSRLFATTVVDSVGMQVGETHPFAHAFVDVFLSADRRFVRLNLSIDPGLLMSGRVFDPLALDFASTVRPTAIRRTNSVFMTDLQSTLIGGIANYADLSNPSGNAITVQVRAFTPEKGTEYLLPSLVIPPRSIKRFRGDGLQLQEDPGVPFLSNIPNLRFLFSSSSPFGVRGRREGRNGSGLLIFVSPHIIRPEEE